MLAAPCTVLMTDVVLEGVMPVLTTIATTILNKCNRLNFTHMQKNYMSDYKQAVY